MKYLISYYYIQSDHILATPSYDYEEIVETKSNLSEKESEKVLCDYIQNKTDEYGYSFIRKDPPSFGFHYISNQGGVIVEKYTKPIEPKVTQI